MMKRAFLLVVGFCLPSWATEFWQTVEWVTPDGVVMHANYHPAAHTQRMTWVLQHGLGSQKGEWTPLAEALAKSGQGVFAFDARGHGDSRLTKRGQTVAYEDFAAPDWQKMPADMESAVRLLRQQYGLSASRLAVGGASLGANVALVYAANHSDVPAVLLLSPGMNYAGIGTAEAFEKYGKRPLLLAASPGDVYAFQTVQTFARQRTDTAMRLVEGPGRQHGVNMLDEGTLSKITNWMRGF